MPRVKVKYLNVYSGLTKKKEEWWDLVEPFTLENLLDTIFRKYGPKLENVVMTDEHRLNPHVWILVNQDRKTHLNLVLKDGDKVVFSFPLMGG
jgi:molybdopterin converting factor small subunit